MVQKFPPIYDDETVRKKFAKIKPTSEQRRLAKQWLSKLKKGELKDEVKNYEIFKEIILGKILGYPVAKLDFEKKHVEFSYTDSQNVTHVCFECKGTKTNLWERQSYGKLEQELPVEQTWNNMGRFPSLYGICTNYSEFVLLDKNHGTTKCHTFDFESIEDDEDRLKEFIGLFSYQELVLVKSLEGLYKISSTRQTDFAKEFYKLYHETRLMMVEAFRFKLDEDEVSEAVKYAQLYLNRLTFIFFAQDRGNLEDRLFTKRVVRTLENANINDQSKMVSEDIVALFKQLDAGEKARPPFQEIFGFNGGLFRDEIPGKAFFYDLRPPGFFDKVRRNSRLSKSTRLDEPTERAVGKYGDELSPIIRNLLLMDRFDFMKEVGVNIMGHILEQSISDLEELQGGEATKRKKDGVYYTPQYITEYICNSTIIPYLSEKESSTVDELISEYDGRLDVLEKKLRAIRILDPACGSGAFLIKAAETLMGIDEAIQKSKQTGATQKTMHEYQYEKEIARIVENSIFGVDVNEESVEIAKLSIFLKISGGDRKLTDLSKNIRVGNSLIDFKWEENFPEGFDIVIGNPPYVGAKALSRDGMDDQKSFFKTKYVSAKGVFDLYVLFIEQGINLLKKDGQFGFIIPNKFMIKDYGCNIRKFLLNTTQLREIVDVSKEDVFPDADVYPHILILTKPSEIPVSYNFRGIIGLKNKHFENQIPIKFFKELPDNIFVIYFTDTQFKILNKIIKLGKPLWRHCKLHGGTTGFAAKKTSTCIIDGETTHKNVDFIVTGNIDPYKITLGNVLYMKKNYKKPKLILQKHVISDGKISLFESNKIVIGGLTKRIEAAYDKIGLGLGVNVYAATDFETNPNYILGFLNSKLLTFYYTIINQATHLAGDYFAINKGQLENIPIKQMEEIGNKKLSPKISQLCEQSYKLRKNDKLLTLVDEQLDKKMVGVVDNILLSIIEKRNTTNLLAEQQEFLDDLIDNIIYKLYYLSDDERKIIESSV